MYIPTKFKNDDTNAIFDFCERYSFATLVSGADESISANHFPLLLDRSRGANGTLIGHMAKNNPQWKTWNKDSEILCIFNGPNRYVSPSWYANPLNVPTWNYAVVHMTGTAKILESESEIETILNRTVEHFENIEGSNWKYDLPEEFRRNLTQAIVGFEIEITKIDAKFKLSQNRNEEDREAVINALSRKTDFESQAMLALMKTKSQKTTL